MMTQSEESQVKNVAKDNTEETVHILITQCLQNDFMLSNESRLALPETVVKRMLLAHDERQKIENLDDHEGNSRNYPEEDLKIGPLYTFFDRITNPVTTSENLHIIHIRDWHAPSSAYDDERRLYGIHCEQDTWEAEYLFNQNDNKTKILQESKKKQTPPVFQRFFTPWEVSNDANDRQYGEALAQSPYGYPQKHGKKLVHYYDVRSDSVFDFKAPQSNALRKHLEGIKSADKNASIKSNYQQLCGSNTPSMPKQSTIDNSETLLQAILDKLIKDKKAKFEGDDDNKTLRVYVVLIGVYTDIKIKTMLTSLRTRYKIDNLILSDVLTAAPTLDRHLEALDFCSKVLNVEVIHSLKELTHTLEPHSGDNIPTALLSGQIDFNKYRTFFRDKQQILTYQDEQLLDYTELTHQRSLATYKEINQANKFLIRVGRILIGYTVFVAIISFIFAVLERPLDPTFVLIPGGLSVAQIFTSFFLIPRMEMQGNLKDLVRLRNYLETYSSVTGLIRFHLTKAENLRYPENEEDQERVEKELKHLENQIKLVQTASERLSITFRDLSPSQSISPERANELFNQDNEAPVDSVG